MAAVEPNLAGVRPRQGAAEDARDVRGRRSDDIGACRQMHEALPNAELAVVPGPSHFRLTLPARSGEYVEGERGVPPPVFGVTAPCAPK